MRQDLIVRPYNRMIATQSSDYTHNFTQKGTEGWQTVKGKCLALSETIGRMQCNLPADHTFKVLSQEPLQNYTVKKVNTEGLDGGSTDG